ncbi:hypothetical protein IQ06DRAFT_349658 [Phaeosphaeriaceae sp. SRC1lsM3a]|nr:hypothetical protein IQ06DRAFT_349658 [Stagonospora sp. SRC1lsM3a]
MSLRRMSSNDPSVSSPLSQVMSAADGVAPPPPSNQTTTDIAMDDLSFDSVFDSVEDYPPVIDPHLPTGPTGCQCEQYTYGSAAWSFTPPQTDYSSSTPHQEPVVPLPQSVQNDHGDITALKDAIMALAPLIHSGRYSRSAQFFTVGTARSGDGAQVTAFLAVLEAATGQYRVLRGGMEYFWTYHDAMAHLLTPMEHQMSAQLQRDEANGNFGPFETAKKPTRTAVAEWQARHGRAPAKRRLTTID